MVHGSYAKDGAILDANESQQAGGLSTGIGVSPVNSGFPLQQSATAADFAAARIGSPTGQNGILVGTVVGGTGYTNGVYTLNAANGGLTGGTGDLNGALQVTVAGGIITSVVTLNAGRYLTAPAVSLAALGAGSGGAIPLTVPADGVVNVLGAAYGTGKGTRYLVAAGAVAINAAVSGGYLNRSTRAMVAGDAVWAVAP